MAPLQGSRPHWEAITQSGSFEQFASALRRPTGWITRLTANICAALRLLCEGSAKTSFFNSCVAASCADSNASAAQVSTPSAADQRNGSNMVANAPARADITPIWRAEWPAAVLVLGVAITWGASFPVVKSTVGEVSPPRLVGWRFIVATVTLLMLRPRVLYELNRRTLTRGSVLGALLGIGLCSARWACRPRRC